MNTNKIEYLKIKERLYNDDIQAYGYVMSLEECLRAERDITNKLMLRLEKMDKALKEKIGIKDE